MLSVLCSRKKAVSAFFLLFFSFLSCSSPSSWQSSHHYQSPRAYRSKQILCKASDSYKTIQLEIIKTPSSLCAYLHTLSQEFSELESFKGYSEVTLSTENDKKLFIAPRLQGGQKILLPEEALQWILNALNQNETVLVQVGSHLGEFPITDLPQEIHHLSLSPSGIRERLEQCSLSGSLCIFSFP